VVGEGVKQTLLTDADGRAEFSCPAPAVGLSLKPGSGVKPYSLCDITISLPASGEINIKGCQVFPYVVSYINLTAPDHKGRLEIAIPPHGMSLRYGKQSGARQLIANADTGNVPEFITVHCGRPEEKAPDVTVSFSDFIANIASGMLYPTWPDSALRAEMLSIITQARRIIASGVHRGRGYNIAAEPDGSMHYFQERMIFEPFRRLSAELSPFCIKGGDSAKLFNSDRWESLALASKGKTELEIIKNRFGDSARIEECRKAVSAFAEYSEPNLTHGKIMEMQKCLNNIAVWYPSIPMIVNVNGILNNATRIALQAYRKQFGLPESPDLDNTLIRSIDYVCSKLKKYSGGCACNQKKKKVLVEGDKNNDVVRLQHYLNGLSRHYGVKRIPPLTVTGQFDENTRASLTAFQRFKKLPLSGVADHATGSSLKRSAASSRTESAKKKHTLERPLLWAPRVNMSYISRML
jgi:peptidoglycan hydrolase-like protein with peptidoglycan-binding domain